MNKMSINVTSHESEAHRSNKLSWLTPTSKAGNKATMNLEEIKRDQEFCVLSFHSSTVGYSFRI